MHVTASKRNAAGDTGYTLRLAGPPSSNRAGNITIARKNTNTPSTAIPTSRNGNVSSQKMGYKISANSASGQHNTSKISHNKNFIADTHGIGLVDTFNSV